MQTSRTEPESRVPESSQIQVVADVHEQPRKEDEPSMQVVQEEGEIQEEDLDEYGMPERQAVVELPACIPETGLKQVFGVELSPEDKTIYSMGDSPVKSQVLRPSSPVRARVFPPKTRGQNVQVLLPRESRCAILTY